MLLKRICTWPIIDEWTSRSTIWRVIQLCINFVLILLPLIYELWIICQAKIINDIWNRPYFRTSIASIPIDSVEVMAIKEMQSIRIYLASVNHFRSNGVTLSKYIVKRCDLESLIRSERVLEWLNSSLIPIWNLPTIVVVIPI